MEDINLTRVVRRIRVTGKVCPIGSQGMHLELEDHNSIGGCETIKDPIFLYIRHLSSPQAVVPRMTHRDPVISQLCCAAVKTVLEHDLEGAAAKEAVQLIADLVKKKKCLCPPDVVGILVSLNLREAETANVKATGRPHSSSKGPSFLLARWFRH